MSDFDAFEELLDAYALGTLAHADRERVRAHLATCARCRQSYDEIRNVLDALPQALEAPAPSAASKARLLARLDAPARPSIAAAPPIAPVPPIAPAPPAAPARAAEGHRSFPWSGALAAGLAFALLGDAWLAWRLQQHSPSPVAVATPVAAPTTPAPAPTLAPATPKPAASPVRTPVASPSPAGTPGAILLQRVALLQRELDAERRASAEREVRDQARITVLSNALASEPRVALATPGPAASAAPTVAPRDLVGALSGGRVFGVDGVVGSEPWHLTIVQPPGGADAEIFSDVPHAPAGDTYRTWVVRAGKTYDAGELRAGTRAHLDMPMPLQDGDVVAFSREPVGSGSAPTTPFLMTITIKS